MPRDARLFLDDILDACRKIRRYTVELTLEQFRSDEKTLDAVVRNLEVIGEAAKKLPHQLRNRIIDVEWQRIAGLRDILIHDYFGIWKSFGISSSRRCPTSSPASKSSCVPFEGRRTPGSRRQAGGGPAGQSPTLQSLIPCLASTNRLPPQNRTAA